MIRDWFWEFILALFLLTGLTVLVLCITADRTVRGYYLYKGASGELPAYCIAADIDWQTDPNVSCYSDPDKAIEALAKLKGLGK